MPTTKPKNPALVAAGFLDELNHLADLVRTDPEPLRHSLKRGLIDRLWLFVERSVTGSESRAAALALIEVAGDVLRHLEAGSVTRASWQADRFEDAVLRFRASFDYLAYHGLVEAQMQRIRAGHQGGKRPKRSAIRQKLVDALTDLRSNASGISMHHALVALKTSPVESLRVEKVAEGWRIEDQDAEGGCPEVLDQEQIKSLWKAARSRQ